MVALIRTHFEDKYADLDGQIPANIPVYSVPEHDEPRFSCFGEAEGGVSETCCIHLDFQYIMDI